jgi:hypothetical protein
MHKSNYGADASKRVLILRYFLVKVCFFMFLIIFSLYSRTEHIYAQTCLTREQVSNDSRCLYIVDDKVYQQGSRDTPHQGHPCGTDVTSIIPGSHRAMMNVYLTPNYVGNVCSIPTPTNKIPTPAETSSPTVASHMYTPIPTSGVNQALVVQPPVPTSKEEPSPDLSIFKEIDSGKGDLTSYERFFAMAYSSVLHCFGSKISTNECTDSKSGDINNDGKITEVDYNLIMVGFNKISKQKILQDRTAPLSTTNPTQPTSFSFKTQPVLAKGIFISKVFAGGSLISIVLATGVTIYLNLKLYKKKHAKTV